MLQELDVHNLTNNIAIIWKRLKGGYGEWSLLADKVRRNSNDPIDGDADRAPDWENATPRYTNIREKSIEELETAHSTKDSKRLKKSLPSEAGEGSRA